MLGIQKTHGKKSLSFTTILGPKMLWVTFSESKHRRETSNLSLKEADDGSPLPKSVTQDVWVGMYAKTRWWFQIVFFFTPIPGEMIQSDEHIFFRWVETNRQLIYVLGFLCSMMSTIREFDAYYIPVGWSPVE